MKAGDKVVAVEDSPFGLYRAGDTGKVYSRYNEAMIVNLDRPNDEGKTRITVYAVSWRKQDEAQTA